MPTITKTWTFNTDAEGFNTASPDNASIEFGFLSTDGSPANGCLQFTTTQNSLTTSSETVHRTLANESFETWGVPQGATVTHAQITAWRQKVASDGGLDNFTLQARLIDAFGLPICSDLLSSDAVPYTGAWESKAAGTQQAIDSDSQQSTQNVRLELEWLVTTQIAGTNVDARFDTFELTLTYTEGSPGGIDMPGAVISNLDGMVFMKGFAYAARGSGFTDTIGLAALQECSINLSKTHAYAMGPESKQPLGVGETEEVLSGTIRHLVMSTEQLQTWIGGTSSYSGGTGETTWTKLIDQDGNPFNLRLKTPEDGSDMEILVYKCLATNIPIIEGSANREWKVFGVDWRAFGQSTSEGKKLIEVIRPGNETGSS